MKIAVIYGGRSAEREVSLHSGEQIIEALRGLGYEVSGFDLDPTLFSDLQNFQPDVVFLGLHGRFGEDGTIQGALELLGYPYVGSGVLASALAIDKLQTKRMLASAGLPVPRGHAIYISELAKHPDHVREVTANLEYPVIIKPNREGSTIGLTLAHSVEEAEAGIAAALTYDPAIVVEEYIEGTEVTVALYGDPEAPEVLGVIEIIPLAKLYDYESKYTEGGSQHLLPARLPADLYEQVENYAKRAYQILGCQDYARVDMIVTTTGPIILEVNTLPGMTSTSLVPDAARYAGYSFPEFLDLLIQRAYARANQESTRI